MPYSPTTWVTGGAPGIDGVKLNNLESQYSEATLSFEQDLFTSFVYSGLTSAKDGTIASQLNVAAGVAFVLQTDGTRRRRAPAGTNFSTSGHPSTTMWLFLQSDGTYAWQTSSTPPTNALSIAHATTDASSNILVVTDDRIKDTALLSGMVGGLVYKGTALTLDNGTIDTPGYKLNDPVNNTYSYIDQNAEVWRIVGRYRGGAETQLFGVRVQDALATFTGGLNTGAISSFFPATGQYDALNLYSSHDNTYQDALGSADPSFFLGVGLYAYDVKGNGPIFYGGTKNSITFPGAVQWGAGVSGNFSRLTWDPGNTTNVYWAPQSGASALGHTFVAWSGAAQVNAFSIGGQHAGALSWIDNGGNLTVGPNGGNVITASAVGNGYGQIYWHSKDNLTPEFSWTMDSRPAAPLAMQIARQGVNGFSFLDIFHIDLNGNITIPFGAGLPTSRNGVGVVSVPIYTGYTGGANPTNPPTGSIRIDA